ncbi:FAD-dependent monooxygenase [Streptomyces sp. GLT-R25]
MSVADAEVDVLIVGGGPVGLTARALLERWGVRVSLVEKHGELSPFPRSRLVNVRSMEIYRGLGLADEITVGAFGPEYGRIRFRDTLHDPDFATAAMVGINAPIPESPVTGAVTSQDRLEPTLLAAADAEMRFGAELVDLTEEADSVVAVLLDRRSGEETRVRARYVLAADGANSTVRQRLGIGTAGPGLWRPSPPSCSTPTSTAGAPISPPGFTSPRTDPSSRSTPKAAGPGSAPHRKTPSAPTGRASSRVPSDPTPAYEPVCPGCSTG